MASEKAKLIDRCGLSNMLNNVVINNFLKNFGLRRTYRQICRWVLSSVYAIPGEGSAGRDSERKGGRRVDRELSHNASEP